MTRKAPKTFRGNAVRSEGEKPTKDTTVNEVL